MTPYGKLCIIDAVKNINVKVFNLMSRTKETRHIKWHENCKCKCRLHASVSNHKQRWNKDICDAGFIYNLVIVNASVINYVILESI